MTPEGFLAMLLLAEMLQFNPTIRDHYQIWKCVNTFHNMRTMRPPQPDVRLSDESEGPNYIYLLMLDVSQALGQYAIQLGARP